MKMPRMRTVIRTIILVPIAAFAVLYIVGAVILSKDDDSIAPLKGVPASYRTIALFGATGTAGDGILKAALADASIDKIHVITRRESPRIKAGVESGKVEMTLHQDYLDYAPVIEEIADVDAVFWAIGTSTFGVDEKTYGLIHVDFPLRFVTEWSVVSSKPATSFHYISSSDISADSSAMWAREKVRAEQALFEFATDTKMRVIAYRPDYIGPTEEQANLGQNLLYWFFAPVKAAVRARQIGQAMLEVTARESEFENGDKLHTRKIIRHSDAYELRTAQRAAED